MEKTKRKKRFFSFTAIFKSVLPFANRGRAMRHKESASGRGLREAALLVLFVLCQISSARILTGTVTDDDGQPVVGANVVVRQGGVRGVTTDEKGQYLSLIHI